MMPSLSIEDLPDMSPAQLRAAWRDQYRRPAPDIGPDLLRRGLAWKIQARVNGGLTTSTRKAIEKAQAQLARKGSVASSPDFVIKPGTRLVREWHGKTHHVLVLDKGFEHEGRLYESLSQIAKAITGAHWSGPRFFGLSRRTSEVQRASSNG